MNVPIVHRNIVAERPAVAGRVTQAAEEEVAIDAVRAVIVVADDVAVREMRTQMIDMRRCGAACIDQSVSRSVGRLQPRNETSVTPLPPTSSSLDFKPFSCHLCGARYRANPG